MAPELQGMEKIAEVIREHYDLGAVETPRQLESVHQRRHRKMIVDTETGRFLVKTYKHDPVVLDALAFQHRLSDHLRQNQLPAAKIQRARDGRGVVVAGNWALELQRFMEGRPMRITSRTLGTTSRALGRFHRVCRGLPTPPRDTRMWRFSEVPRKLLAEFYETAREQGASAEASAHCDAIARFLVDATEALSIERRSSFETGLIHGDWHGGNLLFRGEKLVAILDLEFAGDGCYLEDLAYGVSNLCVRTTVNEEKLAVRTQLVLDNYQRERTLSFAEHVALYYAVGVKHVTTVCYQSRQDGKVAGYTPAEWLERLAQQCAWLSEAAHNVRWGGIGPEY